MKTSKLYKVRGMWCRPDTQDEYIVKEMSMYRPLGIEPGDIVLDIGANIGAFSKQAIQAGSRFVICVEPERSNVRMLERNLKKHPDDFVVYEAAAIPSTDGPSYMTLHLANGPGSGKHSLLSYRGRTKTVQVATVAFTELLDYGPTVLKVDIEGFEYSLLSQQNIKAIRRAGVRKIAVEIHLNRKAWREEFAPKLIRRIERAGYKAVRPPVITASNWHTLGIWRRDA